MNSPKLLFYFKFIISTQLTKLTSLSRQKITPFWEILQALFLRNTCELLLKYMNLLYIRNQTSLVCQITTILVRIRSKSVVKNCIIQETNQNRRSLFQVSLIQIIYN
ncbi:hypothetical protein TTHERM_000470869 (macronuclear) [Tetrahymena thermophila SB210]|uniref:Uncharacterized protein n=1 Tax=Tetrahymena thermophila (strain SB210) TaxID=312017 RepID=W7XAA1_TETTS|nr:hypothetical protein TTHERM_000470869 [Tetrahymena thermophila SB210]EWS73308.1 hypothetical protein TTHERM_000470869 [Tetrahymena thermophila SB210]|eukprot:XP_012654157.1 hypothetical protein TTHERM_000470869 [Tetrahymena thermophila SB210]